MYQLFVHINFFIIRMYLYTTTYIRAAVFLTEDRYVIVVMYMDTRDLPDAYVYPKPKAAGLKA